MHKDLCNKNTNLVMYVPYITEIRLIHSRMSYCLVHPPHNISIFMKITKE